MTTLPTVSLTPETVTATEGETFAWNFSLSQPAPVGGLSLFLPITFNNDPAPGDVEYFVEGSSNISDFEFVTTSDESISQIYAFGDSYSDDGRSFEISTDAVNAGVPDSFILPADPALGLYDPEGRWTNGPTAVEVLSQELQVGLTDYAVGGAKSGNGNYYSWLDPFEDTGVFGQIDRFATELSGQSADPDALYFLFASANDLFEYTDFGLPGTVEELAAQTVENIVEGVSDLAELGAQQFLVVNSSDLDILPGVIEFGQVEEAALFTDEVNALLRPALEMLDEELEIDIALYDHVAISDEIRANPQDFGLTNIDDPYQPVFPVEEPPTDAEADEYYFWDEYHPTARTHEIIGEDMVSFVEAEFEDDDVSVGFNVTIAEGATEATLVSEAIVDDIEEGLETFTTVIADGVDYRANPAQSQVVTNLVDSSSTLVVSLSADRTVVSEGGEPQLITFNFSEPTPAEGLTIDLLSSSSDGQQGDVGIAEQLFSNIVDFGVTIENGVTVANITIAGGVTSATVGTQALADNEVEGEETYSLTLLEGENYSIDPAFSTILTTIEDTSTAIDGDDTIEGTFDPDTLNGGGGNDLIKGLRDDDLLDGGSGDDRLVGQGGNDTLLGGTGDDRLWGEAGDDLLDGGDGDDFLRGWAGDDTLVGGAGADTFVLEALPGTDAIADFVSGEDAIGLKGGLTFADLSVTSDGTDTTIALGGDILAILEGVDVAPTAEEFVAV